MSKWETYSAVVSYRSSKLSLAVDGALVAGMRKYKVAALSVNAFDDIWKTPLWLTSWERSATVYVREWQETVTNEDRSVVPDQ